MSQPPTKTDLQRVQRGDLRKRDLAVLCLGAILGTSVYAAVVPDQVRAPVRPIARATPCEGSSIRQGARPRAVGSPLDVEWHGTYYAASVLGMTEDGRVRIHYDGYGPEWDENVTDERIRDRATPRTRSTSDSRE